MKVGFSPFALAVLELALAPLRRVFLRGPVLGPVLAAETGIPLLLVANHTSWWDGFLVRDVQKKLRPGARLFTVMLESELRRRPFLRVMGCVGVEPGNRMSALRVFRRLQTERQRDANTVFAFFPQGRIWPASRRPLGFERGVSVLCSMLAPVAVVPVALHVEALNHIAASAFVALGERETWTAGQPDCRRLESAVEVQLDRIRRFLERYGEDAPGRWTRGANVERTGEGTDS